jgi:hypothetical protein
MNRREVFEARRRAFSQPFSKSPRMTELEASATLALAEICRELGRLAKILGNAAELGSGSELGKVISSRISSARSEIESGRASLDRAARWTPHRLYRRWAREQGLQPPDDPEGVVRGR